MKSYMGIDLRINGEWVLALSTEADCREVLKDAPKLAIGYDEYRVRRLSEEEYLAHVQADCEQPDYPCPHCGGPLMLSADDLYHGWCKSCDRLILI